ncbi:MAG: non-canonical purine NTP pyrophosphatase, partial [Spirochaetales bacterium]|nr:non-canonical purine NTP pyrophosphatase [Spirochaetales bacterium]
IYTAVESAEGHILKEEVNGTGGFGYDPVFYCNDAGCSMALLPDGQKNLYSHRGKAVRAIRRFIDQAKTN